MNAIEMNTELQQYIEREIIPRYDHFDQAHQHDHVMMVIQQSLDIASKLDVNMDMVYTIAAYHDTGLCEGRELHHEVSARIIKADQHLRQWFTEEQIQVMADAAEDHRASASHAPRSLYGKIIAEADRDIDVETVIKRTIQYGLSNYPELDTEGHWLRFKKHLDEKYSVNGYIRLWLPKSPNEKSLNELRALIANPSELRKVFDRIFAEETT